MNTGKLCKNNSALKGTKTEEATSEERKEEVKWGNKDTLKGGNDDGKKK